jgi:hypothetical protein
LVTHEGDPLLFASAQYRHTSLEEIRQALKETDDFGLDDDLEPGPDGSITFPWLETPSPQPSPWEGEGAPSPQPSSWEGEGAPSPQPSPWEGEGAPMGGPSAPAPLGQRALATLTLMPTALTVEAMSRPRLVACQRRLESLLGDLIHFAGSETKTPAQVLGETEPQAEPPAPLILPPEAITELEERMLREWIDDSIPALGGLTPREAVKTLEGRQRVLDLIDYIARQQRRVGKAPGMFSPDYRKVKRMLGLE